MYTVYILKNSLTGKHYIGSTGDLERRLSEHKRGQTISTRTKGSWVFVYSEGYNTNTEAKRRERQIKSYKGGNAFKHLIHQ